jgi:hypothetical protein
MSPRLRVVAVLGLLALAAAASLFLGQTPRPAEVPVAQPSLTATYTFHTDVAGWYQATPDEGVVASPFDLSLDAAPASLPMTLGTWHATDLGTDNDIESWFESPDLVMRRAYQDDQGRLVWLTAIGSRGSKSFHIFEHTPRRVILAPTGRLWARRSIACL